MANSTERPATSGGTGKRFVNEAIALVVGALLATAVSLTQIWVQWRTEEIRVRRDSEIRISENRRSVYEQFLRTADDYHRAALTSPNFFAASPQINPEANRLLTELSTSLDRLSLLAGKDVLQLAQDFQKDIEASYRSGKVPDAYSINRKRFADAARAELGIPPLR